MPVPCSAAPPSPPPSFSVALCAAAARAELFSVTVDGTQNDRTISSNSLINLANDVTDQSGDFAVFQGPGVHRQLQLRRPPERRRRQLQRRQQRRHGSTSPASASPRPSTPANGDVGNQIEDFLKADGAGVVADFISVTNKQTLVGVTDGNPTALTAQIANEAFRLYGDYRNPFADYGQGSDGLRVYFNGASINTDVGSGYLLEGALTSELPLHRPRRPEPRLLRRLPQHRAERDLHRRLPRRPADQAHAPQTNESQPFYWSVTPNFHIAGGGSADQLSGGVILGGGVTNLVGLKLGDFFLSTGQSFTGYGGQPVTVQDYDFETNVGQSIFKASLALTYGGTGTGQRAFVQGGIVYTDFLDDAAVDNYVTPFAGVGLNLFGDSVFRVGYAADLADGFTVHRGEAEFRFAL